MHHDDIQSGSDNLKLMLFFLLALGACITIVGMVPVAILLGGAILAHGGGDLSNVRITTRFLQIVLGIFSVIAWGFASYLFVAINYDYAFSWTNDEGWPAVLAVSGLAGCVLVWLLDELWNLPMSRSLQRWQVASQEKVAFPGSSPSIMARDGFAPYSTADELLKWKRLRDEGLVSEEEFPEARAKIMASK